MKHPITTYSLLITTFLISASIHGMKKKPVSFANDSKDKTITKRETLLKKRTESTRQLNNTKETPTESTRELNNTKENTTESTVQLNLKKKAPIDISTSKKHAISPRSSQNNK